MGIKTKSSGLGTLRVLRQDDDRNYEVEIAVMRSGVNRNRWDYRNVKEFSHTFQGTPILCAYVDGQIGDGHNMKEAKDPNGKKRYSFTAPTAERIVGTIYDGPEAVWTEERDGETWVKARGKLWRFYNPELVDKIAGQGRMDVSAETDVHNSHKEGGVDVFERWTGLGVTILGDHVAPAIPGANIRAMAALKAEFEQIKLRAASCKPGNDHANQTKGVRTLSVTSKKAQMKNFGEKFPGYRILAVSDSGTKVLMLNSELVPCTYEVMEEDHGVIIPERIAPAVLSCSFSFCEGENVELDCAELVGDLTREACEKAEAAEKQCEAVKSELADCQAQLAAMTERENTRRNKACEDAVKATMESAQKNLSADPALMDSVLADVTAGKFMNCMDADGSWIGEKLAVSALLAKIGEVQLNTAAQKQTPTRYAWESGGEHTPDTDPIAQAIANISD